MRGGATRNCTLTLARVLFPAALIIGAALWAPCGGAAPPADEVTAAPSAPEARLDPATEDRILALAPEQITAADVRDVLSHAPAPRIINLQGSIALVTMQPFAEYLIGMGYPEDRLRNPVDGTLSQTSFADSEQLAGTLAWYYQTEGMMPMLIGHSQGGMLAIRVLYELAGAFHDVVPVWNPITGESEGRSSIVDPSDGRERPVVGLRIPYVAALATGKLPRLLLGQWDMLSKLRAIPDTVDEFTGFTIEWDLIAGTLPGAEPYRATGVAKVRNVVLPATVSHIALPKAKELATNVVTRAWIDAYRPEPDTPVPPADSGIDTTNIVPAADVWFSVKKHWCLEAQRLIRTRRALVAGSAGG